MCVICRHGHKWSKSFQTMVMPLTLLRCWRQPVSKTLMSLKQLGLYSLIWDNWFKRFHMGSSQMQDIYICVYIHNCRIVIQVQQKNIWNHFIEIKFSTILKKKKLKKNGNVQSSPCSDSHLSLRKTKLGKISIDVNFVSEFLECGVLIYL